jgi:hypothetical protein
VIVEDQLAGGNRATATTRTNRGEDYAFILSPEFTPFKGLDLKPMGSWFHADGLTPGAARRAATNVRSVGGNIAGAAAVGGGAPAGDATNTEDRYTVGLDARWRVGRSVSIPRFPTSGAATRARPNGPMVRSARSLVTPRRG